MSDPLSDQPHDPMADAGLHDDEYDDEMGDDDEMPDDDVAAPAPRFRTVVLDVDSTLTALEGIDWLAARCGTDVARDVAAATSSAMRGETPLDLVYGARLARVRPSASDVEQLAAAYAASVAPGADVVLRRLQRAGVAVLVVSGGIRQAVANFAAGLGVADEDTFAVDVWFGADGEYEGYDEESPLATAHGKRLLVSRLVLPGPVLAVGDGATDLAIRPAVDAFAAYTGFVRREEVIAAADFELASFDELEELVLS